MRHYYITLIGDYSDRYVECYAINSDKARSIAIKEFGLFNVGSVYLNYQWLKKNTSRFTFYKELVTNESICYKRRKKIL